MNATQTDPIQIDVREAARLRERFVTRARAVFYTRLALLALGVGVLLYPRWSTESRVTVPYSVVVFTLVLLSTVAAFVLAPHPRHGRWVLFSTMVFDLLALVWTVHVTGGLLSPVMAALLLYTIFFALVFPSPIAIIPPLMTLPIVMRMTQSLEVRPSSSVEVLVLLFYAVLNGVAVYVIVYLTGREEKQNREILELEQELKKLAVVEERNRLARDIHDGLGASLSGLIIQSEFLQTLAKGGSQQLQDEITELKGSAEEAIDEVRRALTMMRDEFNLVPQLENMCTTFTSRTRIPARLDIDGNPPALTDEQQLGNFRIIQECLTNIAKHAAPKSVQVDVRFTTMNADISIRDDGKGFDASKTPKHHYGLINMRERARKIHGRVEIDSVLGRGTTVRLRVDVKGQQ